MEKSGDEHDDLGLQIPLAALLSQFDCPICYECVALGGLPCLCLETAASVLSPRFAQFRGSSEPEPTAGSSRAA